MRRYKVEGDKIGVFEAVTIINDTGRDVCLAGERGEIWQKSDNVFCALEACWLSKYGAFEKLHIFNKKDLNKWRRKLNIPFRAEEQLNFANNPNKRLK